MIRTFVCLALTASLALVVACDPRAKAGNATKGGGSGSQLSTEYESCTSSLECVPGLRCADDICRSPKTSVVADYHAAAGRRALAEGKVDTAIAEYVEAVNQYKADDDVEVPVALYCEQGSALVQARRDPEHGELAARVLHRCVLGTPNGSAIRRRALDDLALLGDVGLDPLLLARAEAGDRYLTKAPKRPPTDSLKVAVTGDVRTSSRSYQTFITQMQSPAMRDKLAPCWEQYWKATTKTALAVTVPLKHRFYEGVYESQDGYKLYIGDAPAPADAALAAATMCVSSAMTEFAKEFKGGSGSWGGDVVITIGE
jgi:hypothetical protein